MRKVNSVDLAGLNDFFDTAQMNMRNTTVDKELIKLIEDNGLTLHGDIEFFAHLVAEREREACAEWLESGIDLAGLAGLPEMQRFTVGLLLGCAHAIRARGEQ